ncbi:MAG TPA: cysteine desulfurase family protein [Pseudogracilibacillus sp.]|nr:cysteine desulfurase family protein [Pseudogracilibacillus sp.]
MIYLDNGATTKPYEAVLSTYRQVSERFFANPSSIHELGGEASSLQTQARKQVADLLQTHPDEIVFTSGGTEGNNLAIKGIALQHKGRGNHIITTATEHVSVYSTCQALEELGFRVTYLPVDEFGKLSLEDVKNAITDETILVSIMHVNNEIGTIQPIEEIASLLNDYPKIFFHVDAVQSLGKVPLDLRHDGLDLCTFSGHKIHGLKGTGVLYVKKGTSLFPLFHGGAQESGFRAGTENVAGNVSFARALRLIKEQEKRKGSKLIALREKLLTGLDNLDKVVINCPKNGAPHIVHLSVLGAKPEVVIHALYEKGIVISTQSACSSRQLTESRVLRACGHDLERAQTGLRITLSYETTEQDVMMFLQAMKRTLVELGKIWE